jgi:DNA polymerase I-like protein with 3'-5' exonuclease and polymerase domains
VIEVDVETTTVQWATIPEFEELFLVQFGDDDGLDEVLHHPEDHERIQWWLDRQEEFVIEADGLSDLHHGFEAYNSKFDFHVLKRAGYRLPPPELWHDGMVVSHIVDERINLGLKSRHERLFGATAREAERAVRKWIDQENARRRKLSKEDPTYVFRPTTYKDVPEPIMYEYALGDIVQTRDLRRVNFPRLQREPELADVYDLERRVMGGLFEAEERGLPVNREDAVRLELSVAEHLTELTDHLRELSGRSDFNPNAPRQVEEALRRRGADLSRVEKTPKGNNLSMSDDNLQAVDDELADAERKWRSEDKMYSTYVHPMLHEHYDSKLKVMKHPFIGSDLRIHSSINQVGARHGRMSSSDPNIQNMPRDDLRLRYLIEAPPGYKIVSADLSGIELRVFAAFVGEGKLLELVSDPERDEHIFTAQSVGLEDYVRASGEVESQRQRGKKWNYMTIYGGGIKAIKKWFYVNARRAKQMQTAFHETYPEIRPFQDDIAYRLNEYGYVRNAAGVWKQARRRQRVGEYGASEAYKYVNYLVSGTAADILKVAFVRVHQAGVPVIALIHDELVSLSPEDQAEDHARIMQEALTDHPAISRVVPLDADYAIVDRLSQAKNPDYVPDYARRDV